MPRNFTYISIILILLVISLKQCNTNKDFKQKLYLNNEARLDTIEYYTNKLGLEVAEKKAFQTTLKERELLISDVLNENEQLKQQIKEFKKPTSASSNTTTIEVKNIDIKFANAIPYSFEREFKKLTNNYSLYGKVNQFGIYDFRFLATNKQTLVTGIKKTGLFSSDFTSELINSNPIFRTTDMTNIDFTNSKKRFGISLFGGYVLTSNLQLTPAIGVGVSYDFFRF